MRAAAELPFVAEVEQALAPHGFVTVAGAEQALPEAVALWKRQTWNTNRAVVVVSLPGLPPSVGEYLGSLRGRVARRCGYFYFFWGIGIQAVVVAPGALSAGVDPSGLVDLVDNQWAIFQSVFLVDPAAGAFRWGRTWGQVWTGKFQDAIAEVLARRYAAA